MSEDQETAPPSKQPRKVFLSYANERKELADYVSEQLRQLGIETGDIENKQGSDDSIAESVKNRLLNSEAMIALVTPDSIDSEWLSYELGLASGLDRRVFPVVIDVSLEHLPPQLAHNQSIKLEELSQLRKLLAEQDSKSDLG